MRALLRLMLVALAAWPRGVAAREPNTTLAFPQTPFITSSDFGTESAFAMSFTRPVGFATPPGETNRIFIIEQRGTIQVITNLASPDGPVLFLDLQGQVEDGGNEEGLLGLAFHPGYATNRYFYVFYTSPSTQECDVDDVLARFRTSAANPNFANAGTRVEMLRQCDGVQNHNGGDLHFGPDDGYLYVALGDEGGANDSFNNSQRIDKDFFAAIARIDVDKKPGSLAPNAHPAVVTNSAGEAFYGIPPDNPSVGATNFGGSTFSSNDVRTEFYAVGLRNPWRMSFDEETGRLYCGDVGQNAWEEIDIIEKGGNYGWAGWEGTNAGPKAFQTNAFVHAEPILVYDHGNGDFEGNVVIGGRVYRGARFPDLYGHYIFADGNSANIWSLFYDGTNATQWTRLTGVGGISSFGVDPGNGDILIARVFAGQVLRLTGTVTSNVPLLLSEAGAFTQLSNLAVEAGIKPYDLNVPFWADGATKDRWFSLPDTNTFITFSADGNWTFPTGAVWIKHFELEMTNGAEASRRRVETRFLVKNAAGVHGLTYRWMTPPTNAALVSIPREENFVIHDGGTTRTQVWHYPSPSECLQCHSPSAGHILGFRTAQLNREIDFGGSTSNQLEWVAGGGYFDSALPPVHALRRLQHPTNNAVSIGYRARSYLMANCVQCHITGGPVQALWDANVSTPLVDAGLVEGVLLNTLGNLSNRVIRRGSVSNSMLLLRMATRGDNQMPPLASSIADTQGVELIAAWVHELTNYLSFAEWQTNVFGSSTNPIAAAAADPDGDRVRNDAEHLLGRDPLDSDDRWGIDALVFSNGIPGLVFEQLAGLSFEVQCTTNVSDTNSWFTLDIPANTPFYSSLTATTTRFDVTATNGVPRKFYRIRISGP